MMYKNMWVSLEISNNPEYRVTGKAGFTFSLYMVKTQTKQDFSYFQNLFKTSMTTQSYTYSFSTPKSLSDARLNLFTSGHGSASGGEEYAHRLHYVSVNGQLLDTIDTQKDCAPYKMYSPRGNPGIFQGNNTFNPRNWCPDEVLPHNYVYIGNLPAGKHTVTVTVPDADFGSPGDLIMVSAYLVGN